MFGGVPLEFLVPFVAHDRGSAPGQASLGYIYMVPLHPFWPVAAVAAVDKSGTFKKQGGPSHNGRFLQEIKWRLVLHCTSLVLSVTKSIPGPEQQRGWRHQVWFQARSSSGGIGNASFLDEWLPNSPHSCSSWPPGWLRDALENHEVLHENANTVHDRRKESIRCRIWDISRKANKWSRVRWKHDYQHRLHLRFFNWWHLTDIDEK